MPVLFSVDAHGSFSVRETSKLPEASNTQHTAFGGGEKSCVYIGVMKNKLQPKSFSKISDDELLRRLSELLTKSRRVEAELVAHIGEVDARRLLCQQGVVDVRLFAPKF